MRDSMTDPPDLTMPYLAAGNVLYQPAFETEAP